MGSNQETEKFSKLSQLIHATSLQEIIDILRPLVGNPILMTDPTHRMLAVSKEDDITDPVWLKILETGEILLTHGEEFYSDDLYLRSLREKRPVLNHQNPEMPVLCCAVAVDSHPVAYLNVPCYFREPTEEDFDILTFASTVIHQYLDEHIEESWLSDNMLSYFISDLLEGRIPFTAQIEERMKFFHIEFSFPMILVAIRSGFSFEKENEHQRFSRLEQLQSLLRQEFFDSYTFCYQQELRLFLPVTGHPAKDEEKIKRLIRFLIAHHLRAGVSRPFFSLEKLSAYHTQACKAWELGEGFEDNAPLYNYDNYAVYHLLEYGGMQHDLMTFCHTSIFILAEYDRKHATDLLETLHVYLNCHCNAVEAASILYIHRNTMNYRLSKIHDLTNIDLDNTESFFHLLLSYHILEYYSLTVQKDQMFLTRRKRPAQNDLTDAIEI